MLSRAMRCWHFALFLHGAASCLEMLKPFPQVPMRGAECRGPALGFYGRTEGGGGHRSSVSRRAWSPAVAPVVSCWTETEPWLHKEQPGQESRIVSYAFVSHSYTFRKDLESSQISLSPFLEVSFCSRNRVDLVL